VILTEEQLVHGLSTHCGICGSVKGRDCQPVAPQGRLTLPMHLERVTFDMHKTRTR